MLTEIQLYKAYDLNMSDPIPIHEYEYGRDMVYFRKHGVFYTPPGYHTAAMCLLLAFEKGFVFYSEALESIGIKGSSEGADFFMGNYPGVVFKSSMCDKFCAWDKTKLNFQEKKFFKEIIYLNQSKIE